MAIISAAAFSLKATAAPEGYELVSAIAKSLNLSGETLGQANLDQANFSILRWHVGSMRQLLDLKVSGSGGQDGQQIQNGLQILASKLSH